MTRGINVRVSHTLQRYNAVGLLEQSGNLCHTKDLRRTKLKITKLNIVFVSKKNCKITTTLDYIRAEKEI